MEKKIRVVVSGCCGRMGRIVVEEVKFLDDMIVVAGLGTECSKVDGVQVYTAEKFDIAHDVIIDFSNANALDSLLEISEKFNSELVLCTTGYSKSQIEKIEKFSKNHAVFLSSNTSLGVYALVKLSELAKKILGDDFDIEIIEKHHNKKLDAPSGTALMIADALSDENTNLIFSRANEKKERAKGEIGIHSVRGGGNTGGHEVLFMGANETISISHISYSRKIFAQGAIKAARFIFKKQNGFYNMNNSQY